jgi:hypothetical protein
MRPDELAPYLSVGFQLRETIQYRWENVNRDTGRPYADFDEYLAQFKSKRRMQIKRERRAVYEEEEVRVEAIRGDDPRATPQLYRTMHAIYTTTVDKMWGTRYLSPAFFDQLHAAPAAFKKNLLFIVAYAPDGSSDLAGVDTPEGRVVAGTVNVCSASHFYGRYWGAFAFVKHLHFEACYYKGIRSHLHTTWPTTRRSFPHSPASCLLLRSDRVLHRQRRRLHGAGRRRRRVQIHARLRPVRGAQRAPLPLAGPGAGTHAVPCRF